MPAKLTYFKIRGLGEMVRLLLTDLGVAYEDSYGEASWKADGIASGEIPFGQLPQFIDDNGMAMVQSHTIMRYLARKHKLYGVDEKEAILADMIADEAADFRRAYNAVVYANACAPDAIASFVAPLGDRTARGAYLGHIEAFVVKHGGPFLIGSSLTYADYCLYELCGSIMRLIPDILTAHSTPALLKWYEDFAARPNIKAYEASAPAHRIQANGNGLA